MSIQNFSFLIKVCFENCCGPRIEVEILGVKLNFYSNEIVVIIYKSEYIN
jgi:hypothetical protein